MKIYERWLQALLSSAPCSRVLARLALLAQIGELGRRLEEFIRRDIKVSCESDLKSGILVSSFEKNMSTVR